ncbi:protein YgfX [Dyella soli]|nr:hypothetical protein [Dyella soli]
MLLFVSLLAVLAVLLSAIPSWLKAALVGATAWATWRAIATSTRPKVRAAGWAHDGGWSLRMATGEDLPAVLRSFRVAGEAAVWLHLQVAGRKNVSLLLAPDNSDADIRRRLRMRLATLDSGETLPASSDRGTLARSRGPTV